MKTVEEVGLLKSFIHEDFSLLENVLGNRLPEAMTFFQRQGILPAVLQTLCKSCDCKEYAQILAPYKKKVLHSVADNLMKQDAGRRAVAALMEAGVHCVLFKGPAIAQFYPAPEYRLMSDIDILVHEQDLEVASGILQSLGFLRIKDFAQCHHGYYNDQLLIEVHWELSFNGFARRLELRDYHQQVWQHLKPFQWGNLNVDSFSDEDALIHQYVHLAKHIAYSGACLKHLLDIAMLVRMRSDSLDWGYIEKSLTDMGLKPFADNINAILAQEFLLSIPSHSPLAAERRTWMLDQLVDSFLEDEETGAYEWSSGIAYRYPKLFSLISRSPLLWAGEFVTALLRHRLAPGEAAQKASNRTQGFRMRHMVMRGFGLMD